MNTLKKTLRIPKNREIKIKLPESFEVDQKVMVLIVEDISDQYKKKVELMRKSINDPLFQEDMKEISDDFKYIDSKALTFQLIN